MRVGLYGGSFDPAHEGHTHIASTALKRLGLDRIIWLVSPGNPLKRGIHVESLDGRMVRARQRARGSRMIISDAERRLGSRFTLDTVRRLKARHPGVRFVWIMGADNLANFSLWRGWTEIMFETPVAVISRPGIGAKSRFSPMAQRFAAARLPPGAARRLVMQDPPAWIYLTARLHPASSSVLRNSP